jgi:PKD repeat protein
MRKTMLFALVALSSLILTGCFAPVTGLRAVITTIPSPAQGEYPLAVAFDGTRSSGDIVEYLWAFGDGATASGPTVTHTYAERGTYTVSLIVIAQDGGTTQAEATIVVHSKRPVAQFTFSPPSNITVNSTVTFDAGASHDPDGTIGEYLWDFGDGSSASTSVPTADHRFTQPGQYPVSLVVKDNEGDISTPHTRPLAVSAGGCCGN